MAVDRRPFGSQILFTTGTTGDSKKVLMRGDEEDARNKLRSATFSFDKRSVIYTGLNPHTGAGFKSPSAVWSEGGLVVLDGSSNVARAMRTYRITSILTSPMGIRNLLREAKLPAAMRNRFNLMFTGGGFPVELAKAAASSLTSDIRIYYGATEIIGMPLFSSFSSPDDLLWLQPDPSRRVEVVDDRGVECPIGEEGELRIELLALDAHAYLDDEETTRRVFRNGFFHPGDLAVRRPDGRIRILGRVSDVLVVRGIKLAVAPVEQEIRAFLRVDEVCVFSGLADDGRDEVVIAVKTERKINDAEQAALRRRFAVFDRVRFAAMPDFPRSEGGFRKTRREALRKLVFGRT